MSSSEEVTKYLDELTEKMQTREAKEGAQKLFDASPEELGQAAVDAAKSEEVPRLEFIPSKYARRTCGSCRGSGELRIHQPFEKGSKKVVPTANKIAVIPCGCAIKRYTKAMKDLSA